MFIKNIQYIMEDRSVKQEFPFSLPIFQDWQQMRVDNPVTIFVGENGTGKSTLLEGIAAAVGSITVGAEDILEDSSLQPAQKLAERLHLSWRVKTKKGFFLRAEDFLSFAKKMKSIREEMMYNLEMVELEYKDRSIFAKNQARMPYLNSIAELDRNYGKDLDANSHGESFLKLFQSRFHPNGLYFLDEPETPLSPLKQLSFLSMMKDMVSQNCQFIIATHSPILMAYPDATIYSFDQIPIIQVSYNDLDHVNITRDFLTNPDSFLRHL